MPEDSISRLAAFELVIEAQRHLREALEPDGDALKILVQCETKLRNDLWSKKGWAMRKGDT